MRLLEKKEEKKKKAWREKSSQQLSLAVEKAARLPLASVRAALSAWTRRATAEPSRRARPGRGPALTQRAAGGAGGAGGAGLRARASGTTAGQGATAAGGSRGRGAAAGPRRPTARL